MLRQVKFVLDKRLGIRSFYKSLLVYSKGKSYRNQLGLRAFLISGDSKICFKKGSKIINKGVFSFGLPSFTDYVSPKQRCTLKMFENSALIINGDVTVRSGVAITVGKNATLEIGNDVFINSNSTLLCLEKIRIGAGSMISWNVEIMDSDIHTLLVDDSVVSKPIEIGSNVWIGNRAMILKGVKIGNGAVVAAGAVVTRDIPDNCLVTGVPARIVKENVKWEK